MKFYENFEIIESNDEEKLMIKCTHKNLRYLKTIKLWKCKDCNVLLESDWETYA